jgi:AraC-like DNA-binding protein
MNECIFPPVLEEGRQLPFYLTCAGGWDHQERMYRREGYGDYQWIQVLQGKGYLWAGGKEFTLTAGQGMFLFPDEGHHYYALQEPWEVRWIAFNGKHAGELLAAMHFTETQVLNLSDPEVILTKLAQIINMLQSKHPMRLYTCSSLVYQILLDLFTYSSVSELRTKQQNYEQLSPGLHYIEDHYNEVITLSMLAEKLGISQQYTCQLFQMTLGMRPFEYITNYRLSKAKELLMQEASMEIKEIARRTGYEHPSYFIKVFKQAEGMTPTAFRSMYMHTDHR